MSLLLAFSNFPTETKSRPYITPMLKSLNGIKATLKSSLETICSWVKAVKDSLHTLSLKKKKNSRRPINGSSHWKPMQKAVTVDEPCVWRPQTEQRSKWTNPQNLASELTHGSGSHFALRWVGLFTIHWESHHLFKGPHRYGSGFVNLKSSGANVPVTSKTPRVTLASFAQMNFLNHR